MSRLARPGATLTTLTAGLTLLLLAALVVLTWVAIDQRSEAADLRTEIQTDGEVLSVARQSTLAFVSVDHRTVDEDVDAVLENATGTFKEQFEKAAPQLKKLTEQAKSVSEGRILEAGLVSRDEDSARAIVVADSRVENRSTEEPQARYFRFQVDLVRVDGEWLTSNLEFVG